MNRRIAKGGVFVLATLFVVQLGAWSAVSEAAPIKKALVTKFSKTIDDKLANTIYCYVKSGKFYGAKKSGSNFVPNPASDKQCKAIKALKVKVDLAKISSPADSTASSSSLPFSLAQVSGTPPLLVDLLTGTPAPEDVLYSDNTVAAIIANSASNEQCGSFFGSNQDGASSGLGAGYAIQGVAFSYDNLLRGGTSMCYMKNFPTEDNLTAGAVTVVDGELPSGGISKIFTPANQAKLVKVNVSMGEGEQQIFIRIPSSSSNANNGDAFNASLYFCQAGTVNSLETVKIKLSKEYIGTSIGDDENGEFKATFNGFMRLVGGNLVFDTTRDRNATVSSLRSGGDGFKSKLLLTVDGKMRTWQRDDNQGFIRNSFSVVSLDGSGFADLRVLDGAYKESGSAGDRAPSAFEWRDSFYGSAPSSSLLEELDLVDFEDSFFDQAADPGVDLSAYSCDANPDLELNLDMAHPNMTSVTAECEGYRIENGDFVSQSSAIQQARENYNNACINP